MRYLLVAMFSAVATFSVQADERKLVWADEFDYTGLPDPEKWTYEEGFVRNREAQYYHAEKKANSWVDNGVLAITALRERGENPRHRQDASERDWQHHRTHYDYTSASVTTRGKAAWTHGRIEVRAKIPTGRGMWPAIWTLGRPDPPRGWPACGEIDILENVGMNPHVVHANVHTDKYNHVRGNGKGNNITVDAPYEDFHTYAIDWTGEKIDFYYDDQKYFTYENEHTGSDAWPFDWPHYLILNIAVGGEWGGQQGIDDTIFPQVMQIDYVRVYELSP